MALKLSVFPYLLHCLLEDTPSSPCIEKVCYLDTHWKSTRQVSSDVLLENYKKHFPF